MAVNVRMCGCDNPNKEFRSWKEHLFHRFAHWSCGVLPKHPIRKNVPGCPMTGFSSIFRSARVLCANIHICRLLDSKLALRSRLKKPCYTSKYISVLYLLAGRGRYREAQYLFYGIGLFRSLAQSLRRRLGCANSLWLHQQPLSGYHAQKTLYRRRCAYLPIARRSDGKQYDSCSCFAPKFFGEHDRVR